MGKRTLCATVAASLAFGLAAAQATEVQVRLTGASEDVIRSTTVTLINASGKSVACTENPDRARRFTCEAPPGNYTLRTTTAGKSIDNQLTVPDTGVIAGTYDLNTNVYVATAPRAPRGPLSFNIGPSALVAIENERVTVGGTSAGGFTSSNHDAVPMVGLNAGIAYRTGLGFSWAAGLMAGISPGNRSAASGMTSGGFNADIEENVSGPILAPYVGIGTRIGHFGNIFAQTGIWLQQDHVSVSLHNSSFNENFTQDTDEARPFIGIGYKGSLDWCDWSLGNIGNLGNLGNLGNARMPGHIELRANVMYIFSGSNQLMPGGNALSFANFQARSNFAFNVGLSYDLPSDIRLKRDVALLRRLANGLGLYRYRYRGQDQEFVGVMAQEVRLIEPEAVRRADDGYLRVNYDRLGMRLTTWEEWSAVETPPSDEPITD